MAISTLTIDIVAKLANLERDLGKVAHLSEQSAQKMQRSFDAAGKALALLGPAAASLFSVATIKNAIDFAGGLNDMAAQTGATVEQLSALRNVAELNGVGLDEAGKALQRLSKGMADAARGTKEQVDTFKALGVAFTAGGGKLRDSGAVMVEVAQRIADLESPTERVAAAQLVFGKAGAALVPMLNDIAREGKLTATVTTEQADAADRFDDALTRMKQSLRGMGERIGLELVAPLADLAEKLDKLTRDGGSAPADVPLIEGWVNAIAKSLARAEVTTSERLASFWRTLGWDAQADRFEAKAKEASAGLERLGRRAHELGLGDFNDSYGALAGAGKKKTGSSFADRLAKAAAQAGVNAKNEKANPYAGLAGFDDNRSAAEIMAELHAQDKAAESLRAKYVALIDPLQKYRDMLDEIETVAFKSQDEKLAAIDKVNEAMTEEFNRMNGVTDALKEQKDIARELGMTFSSAFEDAIVGGKKFSEVLKGLGDDILRIVMRKNVTEPFATAVGGFDWSSLFSFNAAGGVYSGPGISAFSGQVVSKPTVFPFANGIGLMGEAGPEAILPLRRGADGKLGVSGGGVVVNVIEAPGRGGQQQRRNEGGVNMIDIFVEQIKASIAGDVATGRGMIPASFEGAYGLNRGAGAY